MKTEEEQRGSERRGRRGAGRGREVDTAKNEEGVVAQLKIRLGYKNGIRDN